MKNAVVVGIICLVMGFAAGWVAKPGSAGDGGPAGEAAATKPERQRADDTDRDGGKLATKTDRDWGSSGDEEKATARTIVIENGQVVEDRDDVSTDQAREIQSQMEKAMVSTPISSGSSPRSSSRNTRR